MQIRVYNLASLRVPSGLDGPDQLAVLLGLTGGELDACLESLVLVAGVDALWQMVLLA